MTLVTAKKQYNINKLRDVSIPHKGVQTKLNELKQKIALFIDADNAPANKF